MNKRMGKVFNILIIGAGNIAAGYDTPSDEFVLSHAHAIKNNAGYNLIGFLDVDYNKALMAARTWGGKAYKRLSDVVEKIDVFCCATSDESHYEILKKVIKMNPKAIIAEKPLTTTLEQALEISDLIKESNIIFKVNYSRRYMDEFIHIKNIINRMGKLLGGNGYYGKGLLHNGSHIIDLFHWLFGQVSMTKYGNGLVDYKETDKSFFIMADISGVTIPIQPINCQRVTVFEIDLLFEKGRIRYSDEKGVIEYFEIERSDVFDEFFYKPQDIVCINKSKALINLYNEVYEELKKIRGIESSVEDSLYVMQICREE